MEFLNAHDRYLRERDAHRNRFNVTTDEIDGDTFEILQHSENTLTTLAYQRSKLFIGTERGFAAIIDISELNSALVLDKHFRKFIDGNVWHAVFQQSGENVVLASSNLHLLNTMDRTLTPVGQNNSISEFGRKNLLCFDSRFVLAGNGSCVVLYDLLTITKVESIILPTFSNTIRCLEPLPGRRIASGSEDSHIVLWDLENECSITSIATIGSPWCMLYMHSDLLLAGINNTVNCYNIDTIELVSSYDIGFSVRTLTFLSPELFLVTCDDGVMIILELKTMTPVIQFPEIPQTGDGRTDILGAELLDDGRLVTCCRDRRLRIWQLVNAKLPSLIFKKLRTCNAFFDVNVFCSYVRSYNQPTLKFGKESSYSTHLMTHYPSSSQFSTWFLQPMCIPPMLRPPSFIRCVLFGTQEVGAKSIFFTYKFERSTPAMLVMAPVSANVFTKTMKFDGDDINVSLIDTSSWLRFQSEVPPELTNATLVLLLYDIAERSTLEKIPRNLEEIKIAYERMPMVVLIGTHDQRFDVERTVTTEEGEEMAKRCNIPLFFEVKLIDTQNVLETVDKCLTARHCLNKYGNIPKLLPEMLWKKKGVLHDVDVCFC